MSVRVFRGDQQVEAIAASDRGFAYGDGLFETMRATRGEVLWWEAHWNRLQTGAKRLDLVLPELQRVRREAKDLLAGDDAVLKLIVTRGSGGRGYAPEGDTMPTWVLSRHALPAQAAAEGLALRWCETRLAAQPALAGIKHCNRLEQVLARAEWRNPGIDDPAADEGLMRSIEGDVVCATSANLFVLRGGRWLTPRIDRCGVAGVCRAWAMEVLHAGEMRLDVTDVETADAVFLCNAVRGILPVARLGARRWPLHPQVAAIRAQFASIHTPSTTHPETT